MPLEAYNSTLSTLRQLGATLLSEADGEPDAARPPGDQGERSEAADGGATHQGRHLGKGSKTAAPPFRDVGATAAALWLTEQRH